MAEKRKKIILAIFIAMVVSMGGVVFHYWYDNTYYVSTDDAKVTGDFVKVTPQISGKLLEFNVQEGDRLVKDQIIGRMEAVGMVDSNIDTSLLRAPISGIVMKKQATVGEYELSTAAPTLALMVDPEQVYISANIEETKLERISPGQLVDISIDQFDGRKFQGKVTSIGEAAISAFSLLPSTSGGTFTKVIQKVPVKINIEKTAVNLLPGTNAVVRIHVK
ncbi:MAG TPA: hemolysin D [Firmicutes bacterium]|jgi:multidrug resistance efflux pump|nr:hemolysin D [Bacillota bacterium]